MTEIRNTKLFSEFPGISTAEWEARILEDLKGADYQKKLIWKTGEGFDVKPYYRASDTEKLSHLGTLPGEFPFVRGRCSKPHGWEIRQEIPSANPAEANRIATEAIEKGVTGISFNASAITQNTELEVLLNGIDLNRTHIHFDEAKSYPYLAKLLVAYCKLHAVDPGSLKGSFNYDAISYLLLHGNFYHTQQADLAEAVEAIRELSGIMPGMKVINVNGNLFHDSGSTLVQELAYSLASGNDYLAFLTEKGLSADTAASAIGFTFGISSNYFMEIAKLRAARMLWARIVEQYKPAQESSMKMLIHCTTSAWNKTVFDPFVNILRTTTETMSAILGGAQSISVLPFDVLYKEPDEFSNRVARNQQIILREESYLDKVSDVAAGSYYIESLTDSVAAAAWKLFQEIEQAGGMTEAVKKNLVQDAIESVAAQKQIDLATRKSVLLGTNQYPNQLEFMLPKIQEVTEEEEPAPEGKPGICKKLEPGRAAEEFDDLRLATEVYVEEGNPIPAVFLLTIGNLAMRKARAMFSTNFFGCAGFEILDNPGFSSADEGVEAALASGAEIIVICSSDEEYAELAPAIASAVKKKDDSRIVVLAGYPKEIIEALKSAGVDEFIHARSNLLESLKNFQLRLGILEN